MKKQLRRLIFLTMVMLFLCLYVPQALAYTPPLQDVTACTTIAA